MADAGFQHLRLSMVKDVAVVEVRTREIHGPQLAQELGHELATVTAQVLGLSKSAASNRYIRALKRLKETLSSIPGLREQL